MTHEELVEKVAEALCASHALPYSQRREWDKKPYRIQARAIIKITGEAILKNQTRNLHHISETHIKILTQGKET